jgi:hypothetical protein
VSWTRLEEALKGLLAGSIPCWEFCSVGEMRVLPFLVPGVLLLEALETVL